jgi:hypothetical protein
LSQDQFLPQPSLRGITLVHPSNGTLFRAISCAKESHPEVNAKFPLAGQSSEQSHYTTR